MGIKYPESNSDFDRDLRTIQIRRSNQDPRSRQAAEDKLHEQHCLEASAKFQLILTLS